MKILRLVLQVPEPGWLSHCSDCVLLQEVTESFSVFHKVYTAYRIHPALRPVRSAGTGVLSGRKAAGA